MNTVRLSYILFCDQIGHQIICCAYLQTWPLRQCLGLTIATQWDVNHIQEHPHQVPQLELTTRVMVAKLHLCRIGLKQAPLSSELQDCSQPRKQLQQRGTPPGTGCGKQRCRSWCALVDWKSGGGFNPRLKGKRGNKYLKNWQLPFNTDWIEPSSFLMVPTPPAVHELQ